MTCKYKVKIKDIQYNYKVQMTDIQSKYKFKVFCTGYDDSEIKEKIDAMYEAWPKASGEGETPTLDNTANATMSIDLKGNTSQETTTGKNLFNIEGQYETGTGITFTKNNDGSYTLNGTANGNNFLRGLCYLNEQHTISYSSSTANSNVIIRTRTGTPTAQTGIKDQLAVSTTSGNLTSSKQFDFVEISIVSGTTLNDFKIYIQLEKGSSVTTFEPYTNGASPNPDYPQDVEVVTGDNTINICGKNLFNKGSISTGYLKEDATLSTDSAYRTSDYISIKPNTTYYKTSTGSPRTKYFDINKIPLNTTTYWDISTGGSAGTFNTPNNAYYLRFSYPAVGSSSIDADTIMIKEGTDTTYEAYTEASYPVNLGSMELCKIGTYQDYIYKEGKKWYKKEVIGKIKLVGNENWTYASSYPRFTAPYTGTLIATSILNGDVYSDYYKVGQTSDTNYSISFWTNGGSRQVLIHDERFTTKEQYNSWLSSNNVTCYGIRYQTEDIEITDTTLISQLEALRNAESYEGQTNISQVNNDKPFIITAKALKDLSNL